MLKKVPLQTVIPLSCMAEYELCEVSSFSCTVVASGILIVDNKVLLLMRAPNEFPSPNTWGLPSGKIETGETPDQAVVREYKEETSLNTLVKQQIAVEAYFYDKYQSRVHIIEYIHWVELAFGDFNVVLNNEHVDYCFITEDNLRTSKFSSLVVPRKEAIKTVFNTIWSQSL